MTLPRIEWPTAAVLVAVLALTGLVWWSSPDHRGDILAGIAALGGVALSLMRAMLASRPPAPPPHANGLDRSPLDASAADDDDDDTIAHRLRAPAALLAVSLCLTGCGASALRTHSTIATVARVGVVAAHPAIVRACESALATCTDDACLEHVAADCRTASAARDTAHEAVAAYIDAIEIAAHADEGAVLPALSSALDVVVHAYDAARIAIRAVTGYELPPLPPGAVEIALALIGGAP